MVQTLIDTELRWYRLVFPAWLAFLLVLTSAGVCAQDTFSTPESEIVKVPSASSERNTIPVEVRACGCLTFSWESSTGFRQAEDPLVRRGLRGPFFSDYVNSVESIHGWGDGDPFAVNYIGHPTMGAVAGFIEIHNDLHILEAR